MSVFQFAEDDVQGEEVQLCAMLSETGAWARLLRSDDPKDSSLRDKNAARLGNFVYNHLGIQPDKMGDVCFYHALPVQSRGSAESGAKGSGQQTKDTVLFSVKGSSEQEVREVISKCNDRAGKVTDGDTVIIQFESIKMYKSGDRRDNPTETRNITLEVGLAGQEGRFHSLLKHGLVSDDVHGAVFTGKFTPKGGYNISRYVGCLSALAKTALAPYFTAFQPEILSITQASPFGVTATRQATHAVLLTCRVPDGQQLLKLPTTIATPTGQFDHSSHHETRGQVPQLEQTRVQWFLAGSNTADGNFEVRKGDAGSDQVKCQVAYQERYGARPENRATRMRRRHDNSVKRRPKGADLSDLPGPTRARHGRSRDKPKGTDGRSSRSRSRSSSPAGHERGKARAVGVRPLSGTPGATLALGIRAAGGLQAGQQSAALQYAAAGGELFEEVLDSGQVAPQPPGAPGAAGPSGLGAETSEKAALTAADDEAELAAAAATGLVLEGGSPRPEPMDMR